MASWNLHAVLPSGLDFFILLSSASGLADIKGQTNYDAENTYEDALTRHRVSLGEKAASLYLSAMMDDGIVAEDRNLLNRILAYDALDPITRPAFYSILDYCFNPTLPLLTPDQSQLGVGVGTGGGEGLETYDFGRQPMQQPLVLAGKRRDAAADSGQGDVKDRERFAASESPYHAAEIFAEAATLKLAKSLATMLDGAPSSSTEEKWFRAEYSVGLCHLVFLTLLVQRLA